MFDNIYIRFLIALILAILIFFLEFVYLSHELDTRIANLSERVNELGERADLIDSEIMGNESGTPDEVTNQFYANITFSQCFFGRAGEYEWLIFKRP